jgi:hypothetical protein
MARRMHTHEARNEREWQTHTFDERRTPFEVKAQRPPGGDGREQLVGSVDVGDVV